MIENLITHRDVWRSALVSMRDNAAPATEDTDDRAFWEHELKVFDKIFYEGPVETTGYIEPVDKPRSPRSAGEWDEVWKRHGCPSITLTWADPQDARKISCRWSDSVQTTITLDPEKIRHTPGPTELFVLFSQERFKEETPG